ncbi:MAG: hypothetical protein JWP94_1236 [Mucilaginibacter sp.]|jgi:hypothetical protein|nr:hypothetical protein [Mucilaginibacter sp.]
MLVRRMVNFVLFFLPGLVRSNNVMKFLQCILDKEFLPTHRSIFAKYSAQCIRYFAQRSIVFYRVQYKRH